ncbi:MAG: Inosine-5'-monophosphate dehydrogenase [Candidatus Heimdallarchaeota archaeon LC_2]|nr:MAG: Inosine-5'-monophosphate dehydrogenase [Candidatus Heimdallarchaeota archaeon LC_2]
MTSSISTTVGDYMNNTIKKIDESAKLIDAASIMVNQKIGALIVMKGSEAIGMLTERDILRAFVKKAEETAVNAYMSTPLITIDGNARLGRATQIMASKKIRRLPVTNSTGEIVGFFNLRDLMNAVHNSFLSLFES